jgi:hypothetical protein
MNGVSLKSGVLSTRRTVGVTKGVAFCLSLAACGALGADEASLEKCDAPKGTLAIAEPQGHIIMALRA